MAIASLSKLLPLLQCPVCASPVQGVDSRPVCTGTDCEYAVQPFMDAGGQPVMIDFSQSIFRRETYRNGTVPIHVPLGLKGRLLDRAREVLYGRNDTASEKSADLIKRLASVNQPRLLVIGGGTEGSGAAQLYDAPQIEVTGLDVFPSPVTSLVADGHRLPFRDASFDAVWIQAVLEHVLDPHQVVAEIHRVLKPGGIVYADTPFMQQVHAGAFDFTRFTSSGHRWLFRNFTQIDAGFIGGPSVTLLWAIRYFMRGFGISERYASIFTLPFAWLRIFDRIMRRRPALDGASGVYFYGVRSDTAMRPQDMIAYYNSQAGSSRSTKSARADSENAPAFASKANTNKPAPAGE